MSVTYDEILDRMKSEYTRLSGITPSEISDIALRMQVLAGEIYNSMVNVQWLRNQMFPDTATGEFLDYHGQQRGISRREASCAVGEVIFSRLAVTVKDTVIPAGTVVATQGETPVYFETTQEAVIPKTTYTIHAPVRAVKAGIEGNVPAGKIDVIVTPVSGVQTVTNPDPCVSGADREGDESLRSRIKESFVSPSNGTNSGYYKNVALEIPSVASAGVVPRGRGAGTVDVYISGDGKEVSDGVLAQTQEKLSKLREVNVDVKVYKAKLTPVSIYLNIEVLDGFEFEDVKLSCENALYEYIASRGVGGSVLLTEAGDCVYHTEGVKEYSLSSYTNADVRCDSSHCPSVGTITVKEGIY